MQKFWCKNIPILAIMAFSDSFKWIKKNYAVLWHSKAKVNSGQNASHVRMFYSYISISSLEFRVIIVR